MPLEVCTSPYGRTSALKSSSSFPLTVSVQNAVDAGAVMAGATNFTNGRAPPLGRALDFAFLCLAAITARSEARACAFRPHGHRPNAARWQRSSEIPKSCSIRGRIARRVCRRLVERPGRRDCRTFLGIQSERVSSPSLAVSPVSLPDVRYASRIGSSRPFVVTGPRLAIRRSPAQTRFGPAMREAYRRAYPTRPMPLLR